MENKTELERLLESSSSEGETDSEGGFTLGAKEALRKVAEYQLPFPGAWAVKIIQSIVAGTESGKIQVVLYPESTLFHFSRMRYTIDDVMSAFYNPQPSPDRALRHLLSALWSVGLSRGWGFEIAWANRSEELVWDGEQLSRYSTGNHVYATIRIKRRRDTIADLWAAKTFQAGERNADVLLALSRRCYACPLPLLVDGRRLDSLQRSEHHGWGGNSFPVDLQLLEADLPEFRLPPGTYTEVARSGRVASLLSNDREGDGWKAIAEQRMASLFEQEQAALAVILCVTKQTKPAGGSRGRFQNGGPSLAYWILDGAVVSQEALLDGDSFCSIGCFLSAEGLASDLSTFQLRDSPERAQRLATARQAISTVLDSVATGDFDATVEGRRRFKRRAAGVLMALGLAALWVAPITGLLGLAAGGAVLVRGGRGTDGRDQSIQSNLETLKERLQASAQPAQR